MQQLFRRLILFLSIAATVGLFPRKAFATHLAGSDISYTCLGGNTYRIDLTFYRDCSGSYVPNGVGIEFRSVSCNIYFTDTLLRDMPTGNEITYPCPGLTTTCDDSSSSTIPGIQQWHYSGVINFPMQCADWVIGWTYCCRNCDITTLNVVLPCVPGSNPPMYISANLDNLNTICNSSPHFTNNPIVFICVGQNFTYNHGAIDPDGDSLAYSLVDPMTNSSNPVPYNPGYSATNPITSSPAVTIDPVTGDIVMNPTQQEVGVVSVLVEEYRNGILIGHVVRDMEIYVRPCNNIIPTATGMNGTTDHDTTICPGTQLCFDVFSNDSDAGQIVTMTWNQGILNATFSVSGFPYPTGHFCWTPTVNDISANPHQFTLTVVDNACPNNGYQTYSFNILVNSPLVNINVTDISCHGLNDGSITVVPVNPGTYSYLWSPGGDTTSGISNLGAGVYNVTIHDSLSGCTATFPNNIIDPAQLTDSAFTITASCTGSSSGVVAVIASGGTPPYSYTWNTTPVSHNDTVSNVPPGTYTITIVDSRGCTVVDSVTVNSSSSAINVTIDFASTLTCFTDTNGIAVVSVTGGTPGYTYSWNTSPVQTGDTATGLSPGTYIVTVTDSLGCSSNANATVNSPAQLVLTGNSTPASCNDSDGVARVVVTGGITPYTYAWVGYPNTTDSLPDVPVGVYTVNIVDSNGCTATQDIVVSSNTINSNAFAIAPVGCNGDSSGIAIASGSGGTPPYTYQWNTIPPQNTDTATGLSPGNYQVTITDSLGCFTIDTVNVPNPPVMTLLVTSGSSSCSGDSTGTASVAVGGGLAPYTFTWSPYGGNTSFADSLIPGVYTVVVVDSAGCTKTDSVTIIQNTPIVITTDSTHRPVCNGGHDGAIFISVSGGATPYTYLWNPGSFNTQDINGIDAGLYTVIVTDHNGCTQQDQVQLSNPPPILVYAGPDTAICAGSTIQLEATLAAGLTGVWSSLSINDTLFSDLTDPNAIVTNVPGGNNTIKWTVTDTNGCTNSDFVTLFNFNFTAGPDILQCGLNPIQLNATIGPGYNGLWSGQNATTINDVTLYNSGATFNFFGEDSLVWTVSGAACMSSDTVLVAAFEIPTAEAGDTQTVCGGTVQLMAIAPNPGTGIWYIRAPGAGVLADSLDPNTIATHLTKDFTTVFVWTVTNGVCSDTDTVAVYFDPACDLDLPSGFTPNGDGFNDGYVIHGIESYPLNIFTVYNRWGNEVYKKEDYVNADWVGQNDSGDELPQSTYYVILEVKNSNIKKNTFVDLRRFTVK